MTSTHLNLSNGVLFLDIACVFISLKKGMSLGWEGASAKKEEMKGDITTTTKPSGTSSINCP